MAPQSGAMHRWKATFVVAATLMAGFLAKNGPLSSLLKKGTGTTRVLSILGEILLFAKRQSPFSTA